MRAAIEPAARVYRRHGPLLRALSEAAAGDERIATGQEAMRRRFDDLVTEVLGDLGSLAAKPASEVAETARALNLMNETYLLDAFGRKPRVSVRGRCPDLVGGLAGRDPWAGGGRGALRWRSSPTQSSSPS